MMDVTVLAENGAVVDENVGGDFAAIADFDLPTYYREGADFYSSS